MEHTHEDTTHSTATMEITHDDMTHSSAIESLCRLCTQFISSRMSSKSSKPKECQKYRDRIVEIFYIDVSGDDPLKFPKIMCNGCYVFMYVEMKKRFDGRLRDNQQSRINATKLLNKHFWLSEYDCYTCKLWRIGFQGGRQRPKSSFLP